MNKPVNCGCGGKAEIFHIAPDEGCEGSYCVRCSECLTQTPFFSKDKEKAIEVWNRAMGVRYVTAEVFDKVTSKVVEDVLKSIKIERIAKVSNQIFNNSNPYTVGAWIGTCECGELVSYSSKYCHMCGVKLDWSGNE